MTETIDGVSLRPIDVDTPTATYRLYWFTFFDGLATIQSNGGSPLLQAEGLLTHPLDQQWVFTATDGDVWTITRPGGCGCGGAAIIPKTS